MTTRTIKDVLVTGGSGLAMVLFDDGQTVHIDSGFGMRQLAAVAEIGTTIEYETDYFGIMSSFGLVA